MCSIVLQCMVGFSLSGREVPWEVGNRKKKEETEMKARAHSGRESERDRKSGGTITRHGHPRRPCARSPVSCAHSLYSTGYQTDQMTFTCSFRRMSYLKNGMSSVVQKLLHRLRAYIFLGGKNLTILVERLNGFPDLVLTNPMQVPPPSDWTEAGSGEEGWVGGEIIS